MARSIFTCADAVAVFTAVVALCFIAFDLFIPSIGRRLYHRDVIEALAFFGIAAAQYGLLGIWAVFGRPPWFVRQLAAPLGVVASYICFWFMTRTDAPLVDQIRPILALPLIFLCVQAPLWLFRMSFAWRIVATNGIQAMQPADARRLSLRQLFGATTVVAMAMGMARYHEWLFLDFRLSTTCAFVAAMSLAAAVPCVWFALGAQSVATSTAVVMIYGALAAVVVAEFLASTRLVVGREYVISAGIFFFSMTCTMYVILAAMRGIGLRLQRGRGTQSAQMENEAST